MNAAAERRRVPKRAVADPRESSRRVWNQRAFVATGAVLSGLALPVTGLFDHAASGPSAETAVGWSLTHVTLGVLFVGFCGWHVVLNRRALLRYLRAALPADRQDGAAPSREVIVAAALVGGVLLVTVAHALAGG